MGPVEATCPRCGFVVGDARYCADCGLRLAGPAAQGWWTAVPHNHRDGLERDAPTAPTSVRSAQQSTSPGRPWTRTDSRGAALRTPTDKASDAPRRAATGRHEAGAVDLLAVLAGEPKQGSQRVARHEIAAGLLELAHSGRLFEHARDPGELAAAFLRRYYGRPATQEAYARDLADWFVWLRRAGVEPFDATLATVETYAREPLQNGRPPAPATAARRLACLSHFYRRALYGGLVERNPVEQAQRPKIPEQTRTLGIGKPRAQQLIKAARAAGARETLLVLLMLELGLRVSEAVGADIEDLGEQGRHRVLAIKGKGQATKATLVPLNPALLEAVAHGTAGRTSGPLLSTGTGRRMTRQHAGKLIKRLGEQIGTPHLHPHELRHAFVTLALDEGEALRDVQDAARHADPRTTRRYDRNRNNLDRHPTHRLLTALEP